MELTNLNKEVTKLVKQVKELTDTTQNVVKLYEYNINNIPSSIHDKFYRVECDTLYDVKEKESASDTVWRRRLMDCTGEYKN